MTPAFYLMLKDRDLSDQLADAVFEAGFHRSSFEMRNCHAAICVNDREGELTQLVREALAQAKPQVYGCPTLKSKTRLSRSENPPPQNASPSSPTTLAPKQAATRFILLTISGSGFL